MKTGNTVQKIGYSIGLFGLAIAVFFTIPTISEWKPIDNTTGISWGISLVAIALALIALGIASDSDKRMAAMANLEFYEKMAVVENYKAFVNLGRSLVVEAIYNDIKGAKQLKKYVNPEIEQELNKKIQELIDIARQKQSYGNLISRLQDVQKEDC